MVIGAMAGFGINRVGCPSRSAGSLGEALTKYVNDQTQLVHIEACLVGVLFLSQFGDMGLDVGGVEDL